MPTSGRKLTIIDAHTHLFPPEVAKDPSAFISRDAWFAETHSKQGTEFPDASDLIRSMDDAGIAVSVVAAWPWKNPDLCSRHNDFLADAISQSDGRLVWLGIVNPTKYGAADEVRRCASMGAHGVGELNADAQGFLWDSLSELQGFVEACVAESLPILAHVSEPVGHVYPGKGTATPERFVRFAEAFTELSIVAAHWGGGLPFYELMPEVAEDLRHVWYDSAASSYLYEHRVAGIVESLVGAKRILWGSDYPVLRQKRFLKRFLEQVSADGAAATTSGNALSVYQIDLPGDDS